MMYFCTLFDANYAGKGIAMILSLSEHIPGSVLYVMAMDRKCSEILDRCNLDNVFVECIEDLDSPELDKARSDRSRAEFCWTCGSFVTSYFLHKYSLPHITYLDSDLMFFSSPECVLDDLEAENASVGLTPHFTDQTLFGRYCVQYVYFKNNCSGVAALDWWKGECLKWCYSKLEDGKYGDQKYLDYLGERFENVREISNRGVGIAYWNMNSYSFGNGRVYYSGQSWPIVFFHYSGFVVSIEDKRLCLRHTMYINDTVREIFVRPYADLLKSVYEKYLGLSVEGITIRPLNPVKHAIKHLAYILMRFLPIEKIDAVFLKLKYRERKSPYSER